MCASESDENERRERSLKVFLNDAELAGYQAAIGGRKQHVATRALVLWFSNLDKAPRTDILDFGPETAETGDSAGISPASPASPLEALKGHSPEEQWEILREMIRKLVAEVRPETQQVLPPAPRRKAKSGPSK